MQGLVDGVAGDAEPLRNLRDLEPVHVAKPGHLTLAALEALDHVPHPRVARQPVHVQAAVDRDGDVIQRGYLRAGLPLREVVGQRPPHDHSHDDPERHRVALAAAKLLQEPQRHR